MCLAVPGKLLEVFDENGLKMGNIDFAGSVSKACLEYVPEIEVGQYTIVHAGFALSVLNEKEAQETFDAWDEVIDAANKDGIGLEKLERPD
ncbi:MAG: HypC/HybG/HupF family hydrogenase formation chaperone [Candidatus Marinimicrobia bacterium]|nr:HypC/HybG/HupF family hydrogenase formation chaperone [Candidatus Neomarinimicrobiota bacterium]MCF7850775.1 HypC/HybG/HupF family hydrogenase formation chaperone [Candidatus Neomarinimicrobiota bacterium]MCF7904273.1 HypC/HybG/HupF family hydrogenase formation chaperone [Candidatus Neomarinimicrobiota bacterium]